MAQRRSATLDLAEGNADTSHVFIFPEKPQQRRNARKEPLQLGMFGFRGLSIIRFSKGESGRAHHKEQKTPGKGGFVCLFQAVVCGFFGGFQIFRAALGVLGCGLGLNWI